MRRRYLAEFLGTFAIVFFGCGTIISLREDPGAHGMVNAVFGMTVAAAIYALGHISAAHFNPAVTVAFAVAGRFPWWYVPAYVVSQVAGAWTASWLHSGILGYRAQAVKFGATLPSIPRWEAFWLEVVITGFLMLVILSVATDRRANAAIPGLAIGLTVTLCGLFAGPLSGCSMNPARSLGPALFAGGEALSSFSIYLFGPILGAVIGARLYEAIRGGDVHAQNAPNDLEEALRRVEEASPR